MRKKFIILVTLLVLLITAGCSKLDKNVKLNESLKLDEKVNLDEGIVKAKKSLEKYIKAINEKDEKTINELIDEHTVSSLGSSDIVNIEIKDIKFDEKFNSDDAPRDKFVAFEIKYDVKYENGNTATENKWVALEKVNENWIIRSVSKA